MFSATSSSAGVRWQGRGRGRSDDDDDVMTHEIWISFFSLDFSDFCKNLVSICCQVARRGRGRSDDTDDMDNAGNNVNGKLFFYILLTILTILDNV